MITTVTYESETWIILARCCSLIGDFRAHGTLVTLWAVGAVIWSVLGTGGVPLTCLDRLAGFQSTNLALDLTR